jgi:hypothetical protein
MKRQIEMGKSLSISLYERERLVVYPFMKWRS